MSKPRGRPAHPALGVVLVGLAITGLAACSWTNPEQASADLDYAPGLTLSVHAPASGTRSVPTIILVHGAGLNRSDYASFAERIANRGAVVFNADWSLLGDSRSAALEEIACLVRFARLRTSAFGGDPDRVVLVGHSAAAAYVGFVATTGDAVANVCELTASPFPDGLALLASATLPGGGLFPYSSFGGNPGLRVAVVHGADDEVADAARSERMAGFWEDAGYQTQFSTVPGGHYDLVGVRIDAPSGSDAAPSPSLRSDEAVETTISLILELVDTANV